MAKNPQLNVRLPQESLDVLEAVRFLEGKPSLQQVGLEVLSQFVDERKNDPRILEVLRLRAENLAERRGELRTLRGQRKRASSQRGDTDGE